MNERYIKNDKTNNRAEAANRWFIMFKLRFLI